MGRTREEVARRAEANGGPPATVPAGVNDVEAILSRWPHILHYHAETGALLWAYELKQMEPPHPVHKTWGELVATRRTNLGNQLHLDGLRVPAARVVWLLHHGDWPPGPLRRRDDDLFNDRIGNLYVPDEMRGTTRQRGRPRFRPVGVTKFYDRWRAYSTAPDGSRRIIGSYPTMEAAAAARKAWDDAQDLV